MKLVIVESPAKARTISGFLGAGYTVESSIGHVRDLPRNAADVPGSHKKERWARLGVDTENDFKPLYVVPTDKKKQIDHLKKLLKGADELYLATDEDREGESIAWHLTEVLKPKVPVKRMVFHEITHDAITAAVASPREIDRRLVDAQETRRILDRLFGYEVSPVLWRLVRPKLSAGRVQSPAIRIVVERERERIRFRAAQYWDVEGDFSVTAGGFGANLTSLGGVRVASGKDFDRESGVARQDVVVLDSAGAEEVVADLEGAAFAIRSVERKPFRRSPYPPFRTSTLQQEAGRKLGFSARHTMQVAQRLYENGYITYMRTDSVSLSERAIAAARSQVIELYGREFVPDTPRIYVSKVKNAQEAHEAIRPAGDTFRTPEQVRAGLHSKDEFRLYELIWKRTVASQMSDAVGESVQVTLGGVGKSRRDAEFSTSGRVISFPGFLRAYVEGSDDPDAELEDQERRLPAMTEAEAVTVHRLAASGHETKPPARYTEASLVKRLEDLGIGRPSTYASIIQTIQDRGYVWKRGAALIPTYTAFCAVGLLEQHFTDLVDYGFTASMEEDLDEIADGHREMVPYLKTFYFGNGHPGLVDTVKTAMENADARALNTLPFDNLEGVVLRNGRFGPYLERGEERVSVPEDIPPDELTAERAQELLDAPATDRVLGDDPATGTPVLLRSGRFGPYVQLGENVDGVKAPTASLFKSMSPETLTLDEGLRLLSLPRVVGTDPETGEEIVAANGRYGPYIKRGTDTRSIASEEDLFTIDLPGALAVLAEPKRRRGQAIRGPLRSIGVDPATGWQVDVRDGRFGPYVTDGGVNASLRREDSVERITIERASTLLAERREKLAGEGKDAKPGKPPPKEASSLQPPASSQT